MCLVYDGPAAWVEGGGVLLLLPLWGWRYVWPGIGVNEGEPITC